MRETQRPLSYRHNWLLLLIPLLTTAVYWNTWEASFHLDDDVNIVENRAVHVQSLNPSDLIKAGFNSPLPNRFVAYISLAVNYYIGGLRPPGYHL
ncbi:MAG TPA: hypothetical protein VIK48_00805, partial [Candidatus Manganitrophaceae bacterium]